MESIFESLENLNVSEKCFNEIMGIVEEYINEGENLKKLVQKRYPVPRFTGKEWKANPNISKEHPAYIKKNELLAKAEKTEETPKFKSMGKGEKGKLSTRVNQKIKRENPSDLGRVHGEISLKDGDTNSEIYVKKIKSIKRHEKSEKKETKSKC